MLSEKEFSKLEISRRLLASLIEKFSPLTFVDLKSFFNARGGVLQQVKIDEHRVKADFTGPEKFGFL